MGRKRKLPVPKTGTGVSGRVRKKMKKSARQTRDRKAAVDLRERVTIKVLQNGGRVLATIDPVTGKVIKRERNPDYVPEDKQFEKRTRKRSA